MFKDFDFNNTDHIRWFSKYILKIEQTDEWRNLGLEYRDPTNIPFSQEDMRNLEFQLMINFTAGKEMMRKMKNAWSTEKRRSKIDSKNIEISSKAIKQLRALSEGRTLKETVEEIILGTYHSINLEKNKLNVEKRKTNAPTKSSDSFTTDSQVRQLTKKVEELSSEMNNHKIKLDKISSKLEINWGPN